MHDYRVFLQEFEELRIRARRLFEEHDAVAPGEAVAGSGEWLPAVDVYETADRVVLTAEIAGVRREDVSIEVLGDLLRIRGTRPAGRAGVGPEHYRRVEVATGSFERTFRLPCTVAAEQVEAGLRDGVLTVTVPRLGEPRERRIAVEAG